MKALILGVALSILSQLTWAQGEQKQSFNNIEVHYMLLNSTALDVKVAEAYDIARSGRLGFVMVSVLEIMPGKPLPQPIPAIIEARFKNLLGQQQTIVLSEVREQDGLYYVGTFRFDNEDIYRFEFDVKTTADQGAPYEVRHQQRMYFE
jgi:hypothetical protein